MYAKIVNLFSNVGINNNFRTGHGQSFLITIGEEVILYDTGSNSEDLLKNMELLSVSPDQITRLVLSHGHSDHTGGLPGFLDKRDTDKTLTLIAHPGFSEAKTYRVLSLFNKNISCPEFTESQNRKLEFQLTREPVKITPNVQSTGEITERNEMHMLEKNAMHLEKGRCVVDPVRDDLSLILSTEEGEVIITGCAHSGILNICNYVKKMSGKKIHAIIGGTHMVRYGEDDVKYVAAMFKEKFDNPDLYLNHCTDCFPDPFVKKTKVTDILKKELASGKVRDCFVGTEIVFKL
jgi:7,8-dihydropterin-6-yl-methyl-4-(beta-D-ribofuranosyl)aminobenzene 5'-phosphate synthase